MKYKVIGWRILVKPEAFEEIMQEGISEGLKAMGFERVLPEKEKKMLEKATIKGEVVGIGDWAFKAFFRSINGEKFECPVKVGDTVTFARYSGSEWVDPDTEEKYILLNDEDIHLILGA